MSLGNSRRCWERPLEAEMVVSKQELSLWLMKVTETLLMFSLVSLVGDTDSRSHFISLQYAACGDCVY